MKDTALSIITPIVAFINLAYSSFFDGSFLQSVKYWLDMTGANDIIAAVLGFILILYWSGKVISIVVDYFKRMNILKNIVGKINEKKEDLKISDKSFRDFFINMTEGKKK